eukprot:6202884-Pleurochrysis_carterae.AAC.2
MAASRPFLQQMLAADHVVAKDATPQLLEGFNNERNKQRDVAFLVRWALKTILRRRSFSLYWRVDSDALKVDFVDLGNNLGNGALIDVDVEEAQQMNVHLLSSSTLFRPVRGGSVTCPRIRPNNFLEAQVVVGAFALGVTALCRSSGQAATQFQLVRCQDADELSGFELRVELSYKINALRAVPWRTKQALRYAVLVVQQDNEHVDHDVTICLTTGGSKKSRISFRRRCISKAILVLTAKLVAVSMRFAAPQNTGFDAPLQQY